MKDIFWCKNCLVMSTRPRVTFDERGFCSACRWVEEKEKLDWKKREEKLIQLLDRNRSEKKQFDCITTVSGGKDGSYVTYNLKNKYKMNPLSVTIRPITETKLGIENLNSFISKGYDHVLVSPDSEAMRKLCKLGLTEMGFPYYGWLIAIHTAVFRVAIQFNIPLVFYSEDGEVEYGGDAKNKHNGTYNIDYIKHAYLEGGYQKILKKSGLNERELYWFKFPTEDEIKKLNLEITHYGFYENWDPYRNYEIAKKHCGLKENETLNDGSYTNFSQTDQKIYLLHTYFMYLKFGFGRANQDSCIDIRRGSMSREQAIHLVNMYDDMYPEHLFEEYCEYYKMNMKDFLENIDKWANKDLFEKKNKWVPKFKIK